MALCATTQEVIYLSNVFNDFKNVMKVPTQESVEPVVVHVDNKGAIDLAKNPVHHDRSKHIDIKYHFIRDCVKNNNIQIVHVPTVENVADLMTKPATRVKLRKFHSPLFG